MRRWPTKPKSLFANLPPSISTTRIIHTHSIPPPFCTITFGARLAGIHGVCPAQRLLGEPAQPQTPLEQLAVDAELYPAREVLPRDEVLDGPRDEPLLLHVDQRLELHRIRQRRQRVEHLGMGGRVKVPRRRVDPDRFVRRRGVDEIRELAEPV